MSRIEQPDEVVRPLSGGGPLAIDANQAESFDLAQSSRAAAAVAGRQMEDMQVLPRIQVGDLFQIQTGAAQPPVPPETDEQRAERSRARIREINDGQRPPADGRVQIAGVFGDTVIERWRDEDGKELASRSISATHMGMTFRRENGSEYRVTIMDDVGPRFRSALHFEQLGSNVSHSLYQKPDGSYALDRIRNGVRTSGPLDTAQGDELFRRWRAFILR